MSDSNVGAPSSEGKVAVLVLFFVFVFVFVCVVVALGAVLCESSNVMAMDEIGRGSAIFLVVQEYISIAMFLTLALLLFSGYQVAFILGGLSMLYGLIGYSLDSFALIKFFNFVPRIWGVAAENLVLVAVPAFVFMGVMLERSGIATGKYPGLAFMTTVPFGPQMGEFLAWQWHGGGKEIANKIYSKHNLHSASGGAIGPETSGWFKFEVKSLEQLKGLKMRFFGIGAKVMTKIGVSTQLLAGADIYPALERGVIDATEFSMPNIDKDYGFYQIAKNNYYPGWHQQVSIGELLMNKEKHDALHGSYKTMIEVGCRHNMLTEWVETEAKNPQAMLDMQTKYGVTNRRWTDKKLGAFEKAWREVLKEESAADATFKEFADSYPAFRKVYKLWGDAQSLKASYIN